MINIVKIFFLIICLTISCDLFTQTNEFDSKKSGLSPEGQTEFKKNHEEYPAFDEEKAINDYLIETLSGLNKRINDFLKKQNENRSIRNRKL